MQEETKKLLFLSAELTVESRWSHYQTVVLDSPSRHHILQQSPVKHMDAPIRGQLD